MSGPDKAASTAILTTEGVSFNVGSWYEPCEARIGRLRSFHMKAQLEGRSTVLL